MKKKMRQDAILTLTAEGLIALYQARVINARDIRLLLQLPSSSDINYGTEEYHG